MLAIAVFMHRRAVDAWRVVVAAAQRAPGVEDAPALRAELHLPQILVLGHRDEEVLSGGVCVALLEHLAHCVGEEHLEPGFAWREAVDHPPDRLHLAPTPEHRRPPQHESCVEG